MIRLTNWRHPLRAGLIAACMLGMVPALQAANLPTERVPVGDLELESSRGQREMQRRVDGAIDRVCRPTGSAALPSPRSRRLVRECRAHAWAEVHAQLRRHGIEPVAAAQPVASARRN